MAVCDLFRELLEDIKADPERTSEYFAPERARNGRLDLNQIAVLSAAIEVSSPLPDLGTRNAPQLAVGIPLFAADCCDSLGTQPEIMSHPTSTPHLKAMLVLSDKAAAFDQAELKSALKCCRDCHKQVWRQHAKLGHLREPRGSQAAEVVDDVTAIGGGRFSPAQRRPGAAR